MDAKHRGLMLRYYLDLFLVEKAETTRSTYKQIVYDWAMFLLGEDYLNASKEDAHRYIVELRSRPGLKTRYDLRGAMSLRTIRKYIAALRKFYSFLVDIEVAKVNPFISKSFKFKESAISKKRPIEMVEFSEVRPLITTPKRNTKHGLRDSALLNLLFATGCRVSEALNLEMQDVKRHADGMWYVHFRRVKGGGERENPIATQFIDAILDYMDQRQTESAGATDPFLTTYATNRLATVTNQRMNRKRAWIVFKKYIAVTGQKSYLSPHSARATSITKLLSDGKNHREVQQFSGHASIKMVELYDKRKLSLAENVGKFLEF